MRSPLRKFRSIGVVLAALVAVPPLVAAAHCSSSDLSADIVAAWFFRVEDYQAVDPTTVPPTPLDATRDCLSGRLAQLGSGPETNDGHEPIPGVAQNLGNSTVLDFRARVDPGGLTGSSDYLVVGDVAGLKPASFTWLGWVYPLGGNAFESYPADQPRIMSVEVGDTASGSVVMYYEPVEDPFCNVCGVAVFGFVNDACGTGDAARRFVRTTGLLDAHDWYLIAGMYDAATRTLSVAYSDRFGTPHVQGSAVVPDCFGWGSGPLVVGARSSLRDFGASAQLDAVRVYQRALTEAQLADEMWWV